LPAASYDCLRQVTVPAASYGACGKLWCLRQVTVSAANYGACSKLWLPVASYDCLWQDMVACGKLWCLRQVMIACGKLWCLRQVTVPAASYGACGKL